MSSPMADSPSNTPFTMMVTTGCATVVLASALAYVMMSSKKPKTEEGNDAQVETTTHTETNAAVEEIDADKYPGGAITVYYGTQTGTAESFAREIEREGPDHGFLVHVVDLEDTTLDKMAKAAPNNRAIFLTATYGEGEAPDNATAVVQCLHETTGLEILFETQQQDGEEKKEDVDREKIFNNDDKKLDYCVFGLGNKQYDHYNAMGKFFDKALDLAGAKRILQLGLGDDDDDLENDFETWKDTKLWPTLEKLYLPSGGLKKSSKSFNGVSNNNQNKLPDCQYAIEYHDATKVKHVNSTTTAAQLLLDGSATLDQVHSSSRHYFTSVDCPVTTIRELRSKEDPGSTVHMEIDITNPVGGTLEYTTADNLGVMPLNEAGVVESVAKSLKFKDIDTTVFSLKSANGHEWHGTPFPMPITIRECLSRYCDLTGALRRSDLKLLALYATDPVDQKALLRMAAKEGKVEYREKILDSLVGMERILQLCPSITMPLEHFLNICPSMQTRFYTISSSSVVHPKSIHLTVSVTQQKRKDGTVFKGICSNHLANCQPGGSIRVYNRPSTFRLPKDASKPIIMIGPGTGVAPMRAFLQERAHQKNVLKQTVGKNILYFGCKKSTLDYIYEDELKSYQEDGVLDVLRVAFSREQPDGKKVYVQHLIQQHAEETWDLIHNQGAYIYVCGGVKMGQDVSEALKDIAMKHGNLTSAEKAKDYLTDLSHEHRFVQELWA